MKPSIPACLALLCAMAFTAAQAAAPVTRDGQWTKHYPLATAAPTLSISNLWGSIDVRAADTDRITVEVSERRSAPDEALFAVSEAVLPLTTKVDAGGVHIVVGDEQRRLAQERCPDCRVDYHFKVTVPRHTAVDVATIMDGRVRIAGVEGAVSASNVNGPIDVTGLRNCASISNVNGTIDLVYARAPGNDCSIETVNGDIRLAVPASAGMDLALDLFNGQVETELEVATFDVPALIRQAAEAGRIRYRIEKPAGLRVGPGGPLYRIASLNGDVRIQTQ